ncbi:MAG: HEAT repeat domain-containing protein [Acidobacteria bacterium]|nr:HEAT repeat domain-containing protein [Acidobacteriota bacterium]
MKLTSGCALVLLLVAPLGAAAIAAEVNLKPVIAKLSAAETQDRVMGVREMMRLKPAPEVARPHLEKLITDPEPLVRAEVVWAIAELLEDQGVDLLEKMYGDPDRVVRDSAIRASCRMWDKAPARKMCQTAFADPDYSARVEVLNTLRESFPNDPAAADIFRRSLQDPSESVVRAGVFGSHAARDPKAVPELARIARTASDLAAVPAAEEALATIATPEAVRELLSLLPKPKAEAGKPAPKRPSDLVRAAAARALARIKDPSSLPELRKCINDSSTAVRLGALEAILEMNDRQSVGAVTNLLTDPEPRIRRYALRVLRRIGDAKSADAVRKVVKEDKDTTVRSSAVPALADLLKQQAIPDLAAVKNDLDASVRLEAAGALAGLGRPAASALAGYLSDSDPSVRAMAIEGMGQIGGPEQVPVLAAAAEDQSKKNRQVRAAVAVALGGIKHPDGIPTLQKLAKDPDPTIRQQAANALGQIGGEKVKPTLEQLAKDEVAAVRGAARKALDGLGKKP